jgi:NAD(P)-dependent dehydrogenase (short-subunit alcohol dehydrogenase family)
MNTLFDLSGRTAVITGGTGVLGSAMAVGLAKAGADIVVMGRKKASGDNVVNAVKQIRGKALFVQADVLDQAQLIEARKIIISEFGKIDILINAAGGNMPGAIITPDQKFFDLNIDEFDRVVDLNLKGTVLPSKILTQDMASRGKGTIINIASMASIKPITRVVGYSAAKAAVDNFTKWLSVEMARKYGEGIRVNAIAPGFFITEQNRALLTNPDGSFTARGEQAIRQTPFARFGVPDELIGTLVWLCADASSFVTGVTIPVDGGFSAFFGV